MAKGTSVNGQRVPPNVDRIEAAGNLPAATIVSPLAAPPDDLPPEERPPRDEDKGLIRLISPAREISPEHLVDPRDVWPSPRHVIGDLLAAENFGPRIWEPASGDDRLVEELAQAGYEAVGSDIRQGVDFLTVDRPPGMDWPRFDVIGDPPYSLKDKFVAHCHELDGVNKVAMLLPLDFLSGQDRFDSGNLTNPDFPLKAVYVYVPRLVSERHDNSPPFAHAWLVWERAHRGSATIGWIDNR